MRNVAVVSVWQPVVGQRNRSQDLNVSEHGQCCLGAVKGTSTLSDGVADLTSMAFQPAPNSDEITRCCSGGVRWLEGAGYMTV